MGRGAVDLDVEPGKAPVGQGDFFVAGFGDDGGVRREVPQDFLGAGAGVFLVRDQGHDDVASVRSGGGRGRGDHHRGDTGLHIEGPAPEHPAVLDDGIERVAVVAGERNGVQVAVEHQVSSAAAATGDGNDRGAARSFLEAVDGEAARGEPVANEIRDHRLPRCPGHESRVDGVDADQVLKEPDGVGGKGKGGGHGVPS